MVHTLQNRAIHYYTVRWIECREGKKEKLRAKRVFTLTSEDATLHIDK